ncbi:MAG: D-Ala-D-Ala carboxypeptidase family metallohydrolase [Cyanobacteria bacterium P01_D01_bin.105]
MDEQQKQARLAKWRGYKAPAYRRWRVYSTFLTGFLIGLFYVLLISESIFAWAGEEGQYAIVLIFSGILGGVIYTIMVDGHVEMPRFIANKGDKFEAGLFGDILLGIAGAVVLDFIATKQFKAEFVPGVELAAVGIVGGYGGRAILQFALQRVFKDVNLLEAERQAYLQANLQQRLERKDSLELMDWVNQQIKVGLAASELSELGAEIEAADSGIRKRIFNIVQEFRLSAKAAGERDRITRMIPLFEALVKSEPDQHSYYAELAFAYKDSGSSDLFQAIQYLDKAISLRGNQQRAETWNYELSRAITRIENAHREIESYDFDPSVHERIIADLLSVAEIYNLENLLKAVSDQSLPIPVMNWMQHNQSMLTAHPTAKVLIEQLDTMMEGSESQEIPSSQSSPTDEAIPSQGIELIKEFEGYHEALPDGRATAYADAIHGWSVPTIGYGTTKYPDGRQVKKGDIITREEAEKYLFAEVEHSCQRKLEAIPTWSRMNANQRAALFSFAYNLGPAFYGSGEDFASITRVCNSPEKWSNTAWIIEQFVKYRNPGTNAEEGLRRRRLAEADLFCKPASASRKSSVDKHWMEAVKETWLKKSPDPVELVLPEHKKHCAPGKRYEVESFKRERDNHYLVRLAHGLGDWYIFDSAEDNHWDTTWENDHRESDELGVLTAETRLEMIQKESAGKQPVGARLTKDMPFDTLITPHITYGEFALYQEARRFTQNYQCKTAYEICLFLEDCRQHFGNKPIIITSGYRPPAINRACGGASDSEHLYDHQDKGAIDFWIDGVDTFELEDWCDKNYPHSVGYGAKRGFIHLGFRPGKGRIRWPY